MTEYTIPANGKFGPRTRVAVNGNQQDIAADTPFTPEDGVLEALDAASVEYEPALVNPVPTERIIIIGDTGGIRLAHNGKRYLLPVGVAFTPTAEQFAVITDSNLAWEYEIVETPEEEPEGPGPGAGAELWPQPDFAAADGLGLLRCSVTGGQLVGGGSGFFARATALVEGETFPDGTVIDYSFEVVDGGGGYVRLQVSDATLTTVYTNGVHTGQATISGGTANGYITLSMANTTVQIVDNVSVKIAP